MEIASLKLQNEELLNQISSGRNKLMEMNAELVNLIILLYIMCLKENKEKEISTLFESASVLKSQIDRQNLKEVISFPRVNKF